MQRGRRAERQGQDLNLRVPEGTVALEATAFPLCHPGSLAHTFVFTSFNLKLFSSHEREREGPRQENEEEGAENGAEHDRCECHCC